MMCICLVHAGPWTSYMKGLAVQSRRVYLSAGRHNLSFRQRYLATGLVMNECPFACSAPRESGLHFHPAC